MRDSVMASPSQVAGRASGADTPIRTIALAGDTMLGRGVGERIGRGARPESLVDREVAELMRAADACVLNLECCISDRGSEWSAPGKPFFFRAPPAAVELLAYLGVDAVTLANNHALDFGFEALEDTLRHLDRAGIAHAGAGATVGDARRVMRIRWGDGEVALVAFADHPADFGATGSRPGTAFVDLERGVEPWVIDAVRDADRGGGPVIVSPHWGPNMRTAPLRRVVAAADALVAAGASLVAGHSAHVFHGVAGPVLFDLGDFLDDYAIDPVLRNDLGILWLVAFAGDRPTRLEAVPLRLEFCHTRLADGRDATWVLDRLRTACRAFGTDVDVCDGRAFVALDQGSR